MKTLVALLILSPLLIAPSAFAEIYKCTSGGITVFSDTPCGDSAQTFETNIPQPGKVGATAPSLDNIRIYNKLSELDRAIRQAKSKVKSVQKEMDDEIARIRTMMDERGNRPKGEQQAGEIDELVTSRTSQYENVIQAYQQQIDQLIEVRSNLIQQNSTNTTNSSNSLSASSGIDELAQFNRLNELNQAIHQSNLRLSRYVKEMNAEIAELNSRARKADDSNPDSSWHSSIATQINAVKKKYGSKIASEEREVERLKQELEALKKPNP